MRLRHSLRRTIYVYVLCGCTIFSGGGGGWRRSAAVEAASHIPLVKGHVSSIPDVLLDTARPPSAATSANLRGYGKNKEGAGGGGGQNDKERIRNKDSADAGGGGADGEEDEEEIHQPITILDPRLTAYFATISFEGGQVSE